ncbi:hypothetical protein [Mycoplasma capricolum]|nr:hypothetical protein [Mycoplasma capricolum]
MIPTTGQAEAIIPGIKSWILKLGTFDKIAKNIQGKTNEKKILWNDFFNN